MSEPVRAVLVGAGQRGGDVYGAYALQNSQKIRFIAVAEPISERRDRFAAQHSIPPENRFTTWETLLEKPKLGQAALICTQDQLHTAPTIAALRAGYDVLLEKPMATTEEECRQLVAIAQEHGRQLHVCHVLRYTPHFQKLQQIVQSGVLGDLVTVAHRENVSWWHMAHSYVRGNWASVSQSCPMILAKCCHDFDILLWVLGKQCERLSSEGSRIHFRRENAPPGAPEYCLDGCPVEDSCAYYAPFIYIDLLPLWRGVRDSSKGMVRLATKAQTRSPALVKTFSKVIPTLRQISGYDGWPNSVVAVPPTKENLMVALRRGPYGRCVYHCANDVVDHQVVLMRFEGGLSVTLTMQGHSHWECRETRIQGSRAELRAFLGHGGSWIDVHEHRSDLSSHYDTSAPVGDGHGGGDFALMDAFVDSLSGERAVGLTAAHESLESHLMAFAAEQARLEGGVVTMSAFRQG
ncbi:MAG: Gfo/Idh/MocA family oxidoreductase [Chloroflexota bacterium]